MYTTLNSNGINEVTELHKALLSVTLSCKTIRGAPDYWSTTVCQSVVYVLQCPTNKCGRGSYAGICVGVKVRNATEPMHQHEYNVVKYLV